MLPPWPCSKPQYLDLRQEQKLVLETESLCPVYPNPNICPLEMLNRCLSFKLTFQVAGN